jgi:hypothetical protein
MTLEITGVDPADISLEDVVAHEFFMEHVSVLFRSEDLDKDELTDSVVKLATASYMIGGIFAQARKDYNEKTNVES